MRVDFLGQPFSADEQLGRIFEDALKAAESFWILAAWAQVSGLDHIAGAIRDLRKRGGDCQAVVGIDGGIATRESLELAVELFEPATVFHDTGNRLFHPKLYCFEGAKEILVSVGSSNLTGRGLFRNYEANLLVRLTRGEPDDDSLHERLVAYRDALTASGMPCQQLDQALIDRLAEEESLVAPEKRRRASARTAEAKADSLARELFGSPVSGLAPSPKAPTSPDEAPDATGPRSAVPSTAGVAFRWWKKLNRSDVLRKPEDSHQRNYVILGKAGRPIDQKVWFHDDFFGGLDWKAVPMRGGKKTKDEVIVPFQVSIEGESVGEYDIRVDHSEGRIANQNNSPTYLNWSDMLDVIRERDFTDWWLELVRRDDDTFELRLTREAPSTT